MKILLFGICNVEKTTIGSLLAEKLGYAFYDLDEEVKREYNTTIEEFVHIKPLIVRDQKRGRVIKHVLKKDEDMVFTITPITHPDNFKSRLIAEDILLIELYDLPENIFDRLIFSDENDEAYEDDEYKNAHREYYLSEIKKDIDWYSPINQTMGVKNRFFMNNDSPEVVVERLISDYRLLD